MATKNSKNLSRMGLLVCVLLTCLLVSLSVQAAVDRTSSIEASGEGSIYDLKATAVGTLRVCTKPGRTGDRWRATIAQVITGGAVSAVGSGASTTFTGCISRPVSSGALYIVLVTWDRPLPGTLPATVTTRFTGPTDATNPPVVQLNGGGLASIVPRPRSFVEGGYGCLADGSTILPGMLLTNCQFSPSGDTDSFKFSASAAGVASVKICGPLYSLLTVSSPTGNQICQAQSGYNTQCYLQGTGTYTILTRNTQNAVGPYTLSLNGVSQAFQNGVPITFGQTKSGTLDACADEDTFQFVCQANQVARITVQGLYTTLWTLFDPNGNPMTSSYGTGQIGCYGTGTHTIRVSNNSGLTGAYSLKLEKVSGP